MKNEVTPAWFGVVEAAKYCGIGHNKMRELFKKSDFPCRWIGRKQVVKIEDLDRYIAEGRAS